jgi:CRAL/TRIO domain
MAKDIMLDRATLVEHVKERIGDNDKFWDDEIQCANDREEAKRICDAMLNDDPHLDRLLVARKYGAQATIDLFFEQVRFRARYRPTDIAPSSIPNALHSGAWRLCGYSKKGCVISNYKLENWDPDTYGNGSKLNDAVDEYTRYVCYMIELMIASNKPVQDKFVVIFDLKGFYMSMVTKTNIRLMIKRLIYVAQAQYPERLEQVFLVNAPYGFETAWSLIRPLLDQKTASKITFVTKEKLVDYVDSNVLSEAYGGCHEEYRVPSKKIADEVLTV